MVWVSITCIHLLPCFYHLHAGEQSLSQALGSPDWVDWWYIGPRTVYDQDALHRAIYHLQQIPGSEQAWRLLARGYVAQGDWLAGIHALEQFTATRPQNPLGHLELAAAYKLAEDQLQDLVQVDLLAKLSEASLKAPDLPGYARYHPDGWTSQYAYPTRFTLPPTGPERPTLFLHAGAQATFTLALTQPAVLRFGMGLDPRSLDWGGDGATFEVWVDGHQVFTDHLVVEVARAGWQEREVDLAAFVGQAISLTLVTTPGPQGDDTADWAGWGEPMIESPQAAAHRRIVQNRLWVEEWKRAGVSDEQFLANAKLSFAQKEYEQAEEWARLGIKTQPFDTNLVDQCKLCNSDSNQYNSAQYAMAMISQSDPNWLEEKIFVTGTLTLSGDQFPVTDPHSLTETGKMFGQDHVLAMYSNAQATAEILVLCSGQYSLTVQVLNVSPPPVLIQVIINNSVLFLFSFDQGDDTWTKQDASVELAAGLHNITISFINDYVEKLTSGKWGNDRNAYIATLALYRRGCEQELPWDYND